MAAVLLLLAAGVAQGQTQSSTASAAATPDMVLSEQRGCGPGPYLSADMQDCVIDDFMGSNGTLTIGFSVNPKAAKQHDLLLTLRSVGGAAMM